MKKIVACEKAKECPETDCPHAVEHEHNECCDVLNCFRDGKFVCVKCVEKKIDKDVRKRSDK